MNKQRKHQDVGQQDHLGTLLPGVNGEGHRTVSLRRGKALAPGREYLLVVGLTLLAAVLRVYRIDAFPLTGDEYNSLREAGNISLNWNSLPYFLLLRLWMHLGSSDLMVRLPSALFGTLAVPVSYWLGKELLGTWKHGMFTALFSATCTYAVEYSQQVRFYSFFLLCASLAMLAFVRYERRGYSSRRLCFLISGNLACLLAHALGFMVIVVELCYAATKAIGRRKALALVCLALFAILALPNLISPWLAGPFALLERYQGTLITTHYVGPRGLSPTNFAKPPVAIFFYLFGMSVYPLTHWLVLPGIALFGFVLARGVVAISAREDTLRLILIWITVPMLALFLVFDPLVPPSFVGADGKYVIYVLLGIQLVISAGILSLSRLRYATATLCIAATLTSLTYYYYPSWSHSGRLVDWRRAAHFVEEEASNDALVLYDGRSHDPAMRYFPPSLLYQPLPPTLTTSSIGRFRGHGRVFVVTSDFQKERREVLNSFLEYIGGQFVRRSTYVDYPLFIEVFQGRVSGQTSFDNNTGEIRIPNEAYGLEFSDLTLPRTIRYADQKFDVTGGFGIPGWGGNGQYDIGLKGGGGGNRLVILSNLIGAGRVAYGQPVAEVRLRDQLGKTLLFLLRYGVETNDWSKGCPLNVKSSSPCAIVDSWKKKVALVGRRAYEGAWREFEAHIFGATLPLATSLTPENIEIRYLLDRGYFQIWGIAIAAQ